MNFYGIFQILGPKKSQAGSLGISRDLCLRTLGHMQGFELLLNSTCRNSEGSNRPEVSCKTALDFGLQEFRLNRGLQEFKGIQEPLNSICSNSEGFKLEFFDSPLEFLQVEFKGNSI